MKNENYFVIHGWMKNELNLKGNHLMIYAIIFGFSQEEQSWFNGSKKYLVDAVGSSPATVKRVLKDLVDNGVIIKKSESVKNVTFNSYKSIIPRGFKMNQGVGSKPSESGVKMNPNNNNYNNKIDYNGLLSFLNEKTGRNFKVINDNVKRKYKARLKEGYTKENIIQAIEAAVKAEYHRDNNNQYLTPEFFSRADTLDRYGFKTTDSNGEGSQIKSSIKIGGAK